MNTIAEILTEQFSDQGIQNLEVYYDSYLFNLKVKDGSQFRNIILIEKFSFDYDSGNIIRLKNSLSLDFGDTETSEPFYSNGTCFVKSFLVKETNTVLLVGIKQMTGGNTIPIVYRYNINKHEVEPIFPKQVDIDNFNSLPVRSFKSDVLPVVSYSDSSLFVLFQTDDVNFNYVNRLELSVRKDQIVLKNYELFTYGKSNKIDFTNLNSEFLNFKFENYHGILRRLEDGETVDNPVLYAFDDSFSILSLDSTSVLRLDE